MLVQEAAFLFALATGDELEDRSAGQPLSSVFPRALIVFDWNVEAHHGIT
jgi:hypothetical protein